MGTAWAIAVAAVFGWVGMVLAISFLEAPLKFRAPGVTPALGLGIGRLVFRALNACEVVLAVVVVTATRATSAPVLVAAGALAVQLAVIRPALKRRSDEVLAGTERPRSRVHYGYVGLEVVKVVTLLVAGTLLLTEAT